MQMFFEIGILTVRRCYIHLAALEVLKKFKIQTLNPGLNRVRTEPSTVHAKLVLISIGNALYL